MIQRLQSLLLAFLTLILLLIFFLPIFKKENLQTREKLVMTATSTDYFKDGNLASSQNNLIIAILAAIGIGTSVFSISQYNNRKNQMLMGLLNTVIISTMLGFIIYYTTQANGLIKEGPAGKFGFGFFVPAFCLVLNMIANRFIRRDERLVKDAFDRIR